MKSFSLLLFCIFILSAPAQLLQVGKWDRFEASYDNTTQYTDPYSDVTLNVTFVRPNGTIVEFWGFYDGGDVWKIRFMPDQVGKWKYTATFSDGSQAHSGAFDCIPSTIPGMISSDEANPIWFGYKGGKHELIRGFHVGDRFFAENWDTESRKEFIDWAQRQGYNLLSIASHYLNRDSEGRGKGWKTPDLWPLDASEYQKLETILNDLAERKILVFPFAGFFGKQSDFPKKRNEQEIYLRYTLARMGAYWNLLFSVAGPEPNLKNNVYLSTDAVTRLGETIQNWDVFSHPLSVHNRTGDDPYRDSDWSSFGILQGPKTRKREVLSQRLLRNHHSAKPLLAQETLWGGNKYHPNYTLDDIRKNAFVMTISAAAIVFADMDGDSSSGFSGAMDLSLKNQAIHDEIKKVWDFFDTIPFYRMKPRQDLVSVGFCLAEEGRDYLVYLEEPASVDVKVVKGSYAVEWINARNTDERRDGGVTSDGRNLAAPNNSGDWLLRLSKKKLVKTQTSVFSVKTDNTGTLLDGEPFLVKGLRISNALISDDKTQQLIDNLDTFASYGVNTISVFFQGSRFGDIKGYNEDATLNPVYAKRMGRIIEEADKRGMVLLVGCLYYSNSKAKWESWNQEDAERAIANTVKWLNENDYRNVFIDVNNEHMAKFDDARLIAAGKAVDPSYVIASSGKETPDNADLSLHHGSSDIPNKYYIESEGTAGDYWGNYSKKEGYYNYINIGVYPVWMKKAVLEKTDRFLQKGQGFIFASTWLQCIPPYGPNHSPGGMGTENDPGVRWWLEYLQNYY